MILLLLAGLWLGGRLVTCYGVGKSVLSSDPAPHDGGAVYQLDRAPVIRPFHVFARQCRGNGLGSNVCYIPIEHITLPLIHLSCPAITFILPAMGVFLIFTNADSTMPTRGWKDNDGKSCLLPPTTKLLKVLAEGGAV